MIISNITLQQAKKKINSKFPLEILENSVSPVHVVGTYDSMDPKSVEMAKNKFDEILKELESLGGNIQQDLFDSTFCCVIFTNDSGKQFKITISENNMDNLEYSKIYFQIDFNKIK